MPSKGILTHHSGAISFWQVGRPSQNAALEPHIDISLRKNQYDCLEQLLWQVQALIIAIRAIQ